MFTPFSIKGSSLELLRTGEKGIVTFCKISNEQKIKGININIGNKITVIQKNSVFKIKVNNLNMTIDIETARAIYVRIIE